MNNNLSWFLLTNLIWCVLVYGMHASEQRVSARTSVMFHKLVIKDLQRDLADERDLVNKLERQLEDERDLRSASTHMPSNRARELKLTERWSSR